MPDCGLNWEKTIKAWAKLDILLSTKKVWEPRLQDDLEMKMLEDSISSTATLYLSTVFK